MIQLLPGDEFVSPVKDTGYTINKFLIVTYDDYGTGKGSGTIQWRGGPTIFTQDADEVSGPIWENYPSGGAMKTWRYVQLKLIG